MENVVFICAAKSFRRLELHNECRLSNCLTRHPRWGVVLCSCAIRELQSCLNRGFPFMSYMPFKNFTFPLLFSMLFILFLQILTYLCFIFPGILFPSFFFPFVVVVLCFLGKRLISLTSTCHHLCDCE